MAQILSLTILVAYEGKHLVSWDEEKRLVSYDWMLLMSCVEKTHFVFHV